jgi:hypothetical protein
MCVNSMIFHNDGKMLFYLEFFFFSTCLAQEFFFLPFRDPPDSHRSPARRDHLEFIIIYFKLFK